jgi:hypothetical protein
MRRATNLVVGMRLALVEPGEKEALVFESAKAAAGGDHSAAAAGAASAPSGADSARPPTVAEEDEDAPAAAAAQAPSALDDVSVRQLALQNTLVASAVGWLGGLGATGLPAALSLCAAFVLPSVIDRLITQTSPAPIDTKPPNQTTKPPGGNAPGALH